MQTCVVWSIQSIALQPLIVIFFTTFNCHSWITGLDILFNLKHCVVWLLTKYVFFNQADFLKLAEKLSVIRTDRHEDLVRPKNILPVRKKKPPKIHCHVYNV